MVVLYHSTNLASLQLILNSDKLLMSSRARSGDAVFGDGVYMTQLSPQTHVWEDIGRNNWAGAWAGDVSVMKYALCFDAHGLCKRMDAGGRDIWLSTAPADLAALTESRPDGGRGQDRIVALNVAPKSF